MTAEMHEQQAEQFLAWHGKRGGDWEADFDRWATSKDFMPRDRVAIRRVVVELRTSVGPTTDVADWFRFGA
jgi:hypothetical protein